VYATYRTATELPEVFSSLADNHEIGVPVHPREFGHCHDQLAELDYERQYNLIAETREALANAADLDTDQVTSFRAGRHSASKITFDVLETLDFEIDASINVRYCDYLPERLTTQMEPFSLENGLFEIPTTWASPPLFSSISLRVFPQRTITATSNTLRTDSFYCSGLQTLRWLFQASSHGVSMYMHPYDATSYHESLENNGNEFRSRVSTLLEYATPQVEFLTANQILEE